jgi:head-tail adaptor
MSLESLLDEDRVSFQSPTVTQDTSGGPTRNPWVTEYTDVPARVRDLSAAQILQFLQMNIDVSHKIICQQDGVANGWRSLTSDGRILRVVGVEKVRRMGGIDTFWKIIAKEIRPGA